MQRNVFNTSKINKVYAFIVGAEGETRTRTSLRTLEPESSASTNSATPAINVYL